MTQAAALQHLMIWLSPAFPVGGFAWSAGLETAIADRRVSDSGSLQDWIAGNLRHGGLHTDAILLAQAHRAAGESEALAELAELCLALSPSAERVKETTLTGDAFAIAAKAWPSQVLARLPRPCPYCIAVGAIAAAHGIDIGDTLLAYLTTAAHAHVSVAVRLVPLGQTDGLKVMATLEATVALVAAQAAAAGLDDIGTSAYAADIAQMRHETLPVRIFRS